MQGSTATDFDEVFTGTVLHPAGTSFDDTAATVSIVDARATDAKVLPAAVYTTAIYANMEASQVNAPIPIVFGDWQTTAANGETVPCVQIDSTAGTGGKFKIAGHTLKSIEAVYLNGSDITGNCTLDPANGEFTISSTSTYTSGTDIVTANVQGATDDGTTSGTLLQTAPDVLEDILKTHLSVSAGNIDSSAFTAWGAQLSSNDYVRRVINIEAESDILIADLLSDGFADLTIEAGKYTPKYRVASIGASLVSYREADLLNDADRVKRFLVEHDPQQIYTNEVVANYNYAPTGAAYAGRYSTNDTGAIADIGSTVRRSLGLSWLYLQTGAEARADKELYTFSQTPEVIELDLGPAASTLAPADQFRLVYSKYPETPVGGTPFQVRDISLNPIDLSVRLTAWSMVQLTPQVWTAGGANDWENATAAEKEEQGFWTSDDGEAGPQYYWADTSAPAYTAASAYEQANQAYWTDGAGEADPGDSGSAGSVWKDETAVDPDSKWI